MIKSKRLYATYESWHTDCSELIQACTNAYHGFVSVDVTKKLPVGAGDACMDFSEGLHVTVGIGQKDEEYTNISDYDAVAGIVAVYHEFQHIKQQIHQEDANIVKSFIVANYEPQYDPPSANYWHMPHEIDAEYTGILNAHKYLISKFGQEKADAAILNYVNERAHGNYFVHKHIWQKFKSLDEVTDAFIVADENAIENLRVYDFSADGAIKRSGIDKTTLKQYLNTRTKEEQISRLVAVEDYLHPGLVLDGVNDDKIRRKLQETRFTYDPSDLPKQTRYQMNESRIYPLRERLYQRQKSSVQREIPEVEFEQFNEKEREV